MFWKLDFTCSCKDMPWFLMLYGMSLVSSAYRIKWSKSS